MRQFTFIDIGNLFAFIVQLIICSDIPEGIIHIMVAIYSYTNLHDIWILWCNNIMIIWRISDKAYITNIPRALYTIMINLYT